MAGMHQETYTLSNSDIRRAIKALESWLKQQQLERRDSLSLSLAIEEMLLRWQDHFAQEQAFTLELGQRFRRPFICMTLKGERVDPTAQNEEVYDWNRRMMEGMGLVPEYAYRRGVNRVSYRIKPSKPSSLMAMVIAGAAALCIGMLARVLLPDHVAMLAQSFVVPVRETMLGLIAAIAVPMVFLSVLLGICSSASAAEFSKIGNGVLLRLLGKTFLYTLLVGVMIVPLFDLEMSNAVFSVDQLTGTLDMVLDIFPSGVVEPFVSGNTLQVIVIAIALGVAMLVMGERASEIKTLAEKANALVALLMEWACRLITPIVFLMLLETLWGDNVGALIRLWKPILIMFISTIAVALLSLLMTSRRYGVHPIKLLKKQMKVIMIAFSTCSSAATCSENMDSCEKKLGVDHRIASFGIPAGTVIYKPCASFLLLVCALYGAEQYAVSCSAVWLLLAWMTASLIAAALPPIPGGPLGCFSILFAQMGIPSEAVVFAVAISMITERVRTAGTILLLQHEMIDAANQYNLLDRDVLRE